jgi:hypothetical protein
LRFRYDKHMTEIALSDYAKRRGVSVQRARALAADGRIHARKVGSQWLVDDSELSKLSRHAGRPPSQSTVWIGANALLAARNDEVPGRRAARGLATLIAQLAEPSNPELHLRAIATWAANRGELHQVRAADPADLANDRRVARSGLAWSHSPIQSIDNIDLYVRAQDWPDLIVDHALVEVPATRANTRIRVVLDDTPLERDVPDLIAIADLADVGTPRARTAAADILARPVFRNNPPHKRVRT